MKRPANILLVADLACPMARAMEDALRHAARVLTLGLSDGTRRVDFECEPRPDLPAFLAQFPAALQPDLVLWMQPKRNLIPLGMDKLQCRTLAVVHSAWEGLDGYLTLFHLGISTRIETARTLDCPYVALMDTENPDIPGYAMVSEILKFTLGGELVKRPEHYLEILRAQRAQAPMQKPGPRSFIIPVLDESPAAKHNIGTLLEDLGRVEGEVICVFNNPAMHEKYAAHPRIQKSAGLNLNVGVGRAWNIGVQMSTAPTVFFLNADLQMGAAGADAVSRGLESNPGVGVCGPCGGYVDFAEAKDLYYYSAQKPAVETLVDQVSFHYFAMRREIFYRHGFSFYSEYLPCFMEELDTALQLRELGYAALRVPVTDFDHKMGGSANAGRILFCLGEGYDMKTALADNRRRYLERWRRKFPVSNEVYLPDLAGHHQQIYPEKSCNPV